MVPKNHCFPLDDFGVPDFKTRYVDHVGHPPSWNYAAAVHSNRAFLTECQHLEGHKVLLKN
jgi:hypothetical protein